jgi:serine/threonine-protein kinase
MKSVAPASTKLDDVGPPQSGRALRYVTMTVPSGGPSAGLGRNAYLGATVDGRYEIEDVIGEGGMGVVYRCIHTIIGKRVAMKVLRADLARNDEVVERFLNEARSASSIGNPHIIDISDFGRLPDGATYFVMEYLEGQPLADFLEPGSLLDRERIGAVMIQLTEALAAAHAAGIVHRDLKPDNIFLIKRGSQDDFVKVLDFGIAKATSAGSKLTQAGQVFGTPHYMSPEQAAGSIVDQRADIYAVGVMLYELLTGTLPFDAENFMGILTQHMYKDPPPPSSREGARGRIDPALERIVLRCLRKQPADRYQSMGELGDDLRALFGDVGRASFSEMRPSQLGAVAQDTTPISGLAPEQPHSARRTFFLALALAGILGGGAAWSLSRAPDAQASREAEPIGSPPEVIATPLAPKAVATTVAVAVTPVSAEVYREGVLLGTSPISVEVGPTPTTVTVMATGYRPRDVTLDGSRKGVTVNLEPIAIPIGSAARGTAVRNPTGELDQNDPDVKSKTAPSGLPDTGDRSTSSGLKGPKSGLEDMSPASAPRHKSPSKTKSSSADLLVDPWSGE